MPVKPTKPQKPDEAVTADPGSVTEREPREPREPHQPDEKKKGWIEIKLIDEADQPVAGEWYEVKLPDGTYACGALNQDGCAMIRGFEPGDCEITFPDLDEEAWESA